MSFFGSADVSAPPAGRKGGDFGAAARAVVLSMLAATLGACNIVGDTDVVRISYSHAPDPGSEIHAFATAFEAEMARIPGAPAVELYPANALGQEREVYEAMQLGAGATCAITGTAILSTFSKRIGVLDMPFVWRDVEHARAALAGPVGERLAGDLDEAGLTLVEWLDSWGFRSVVSAEPVPGDPAALRGMKLRTIPAPTYLAAVEAMGAIPTPMAFGEIYSSLETGVIDGFEHTPSIVLSNRFFEVADTLVETRHMYGPIAFVCAKRQLEKFPPEVRDAIVRASAIARERQQAQTLLQERAALARLAEEGMTIVSVDTAGFEQAAASKRLALAEDLGAQDLLRLIEAGPVETRTISKGTRPDGSSDQGPR